MRKKYITVIALILSFFTICSLYANTFRVTTITPYGAGSFGEAIGEVNKKNSKIDNIIFTIPNDKGNIITLNKKDAPYLLSPRGNLTIDFKNKINNKDITLTAVKNFRPISGSFFDIKLRKAGCIISINNLFITNIESKYLFNVLSINFLFTGKFPLPQIKRMPVQFNNANISHNSISRQSIVNIDAKYYDSYTEKSIVFCNSTIAYNTAPTCIFCDNSTLSFEHSTIKNNKSTLYGGAVTIANNADLEIENSTIRNNHSETYGGGIYSFEGGRVYLSQGSKISNNIADIRGGGIYQKNRTELFIEANSKIAKNKPDNIYTLSKENI